MSEENSLEVMNDEQIDVVDQSENHDYFAMVEESGDQPEIVDQEVVTESTEEPTEAPKKQTREDNHIAKAARLKAERDAKAQIEKAKQEAIAELETKFRASGVKNPYTEKEFESFEEYFDYGKKVKEAEQRERAENEGKTIEEIQQEDADKEYLAKKRQEDSEKADREAKDNEMRERVQADFEEFSEKYPEVDLSAVIMNESFKRFAGTRLGKESLTGLYEDFVDLVGEAEKNGRLKDTRSSRSTGSGSDAGITLTAQQKRDLEAWNRANPDMKMTAKEFAER